MHEEFYQKQQVVLDLELKKEFRIAHTEAEHLIGVALILQVHYHGFVVFIRLISDLR